ncbi:MAG: DUF1540 domain-containing protein [Oscillospiraceae bacterium]|nr:DUF1540 domain-containing protein [Oscillospiraceae bacterium]
MHENSHGDQCIHCTVDTCRYNQGGQDMCSLADIHVRPNKQVSGGDLDESLCGSYHRK